ncbi:MAG: cell division protein FtsQ/DivIB [Proteobacteria bacterium]|nr:cell division protein FtsQ/DivIB [Pseudomonadota bacterium]
MARRVSINERIIQTKKKKKGRKLFLLTLILVFLISAGTMTAIQLVKFLGPVFTKGVIEFSDRFFKIREIAIVGAGEYGEREIREFITPMVKVNPNLLTFPLSQIRVFLATRPYLSIAELRKELPGRLVIAVKEKKTVAILIKDGFFHIDENGNIIRPMYNGENIDVPVITVEESLGAEDLTDYLKTIALIINLDNKSAPNLAFSELRITKNGIIARSLELKNDNNTIPPIYFPMDYAEKKLLQIKKLWPELVKKKNQIDYIDNRFKKGIVVKLKTTEEHYDG